MVYAPKPSFSTLALRQAAANSLPEGEMVVIGKTGIQAGSAPHIVALGQALGSAASGEGSGLIRPETIKYVVRSGDTLSSIAQGFGISIDTIAWANELSRSSSLKPGQELLILPVSGTLHLVRPHDTLSEIAALYRVNVDSVTQFNNIASADDIFPGDLLIVPGGKKPLVAVGSTPVANSYFIYPLPAPFRITQGLHPYNAIDFSTGRCGDPIYAAAGGTVQKAAHDSVAGNFVRIIHPNGLVTFYGHMSQRAVVPGEQVLQGQTIGYIGHTGYTIPSGPGGCHVHFEVRGGRNPFVK